MKRLSPRTRQLADGPPTGTPTKLRHQLRDSPTNLRDPSRHPPTKPRDHCSDSPTKLRHPPTKLSDHFKGAPLNLGTPLGSHPLNLGTTVGTHPLNVGTPRGIHLFKMTKSAVTANWLAAFFHLPNSAWHPTRPRRTERQEERVLASTVPIGGRGVPDSPS